MALWSLMASPLLVSADLRHISRESRSILLNQLALKINQDPLGALGTQIKKVNEHIKSQPNGRKCKQSPASHCPRSVWLEYGHLWTP